MMDLVAFDPWLRCEPQVPGNVLYSFPPVVQFEARPAVIVRINEESMEADGIFLSPISQSVAVAELGPSDLDRSKSAFVAKLQTRTRQEFLSCFLSVFADVVCFETKTINDACSLAREWARRTAGLKINFPVAAFRIDGCEQSSLGGQHQLRERLSVFFDVDNHFNKVIVLETGDGTKGSPILISEAGLMRRERAKKSLNWTWYTLKELGHGMARQLATVTRREDVNFINAFEEMRLPRPLFQCDSALGKSWSWWLKRDLDVFCPRASRLSIVAHCLGLDIATYYQGQ
jgi:hypothetical protein